MLWDGLLTVPPLCCRTVSRQSHRPRPRVSTPLQLLRLGRLLCARLIRTRDENNPHGPVELKEIEECFRSFAPIWHVHVGDEPGGVSPHIIRTTPEHPFYVQGKGWTETKELQVGDVLVGADGQTIPVQDILDTGTCEPVYNFRVADHHTYFVGSAAWGFSVWAHNACVTPVARPGMAPTTVNGYRVYGTAQVTGPGTNHAAAITNRVSEITVQLQRQGINPDDVSILMNRSWRTALNGLGPVSSGANSRLRPDILVVVRTGPGRYSVRPFECRSPTDTVGDLMDRMSDGFSSTGGNPNFSLVLS